MRNGNIAPRSNFDDVAKKESKSRRFFRGKYLLTLSLMGGCPLPEDNNLTTTSESKGTIGSSSETGVTHTDGSPTSFVSDTSSSTSSNSSTGETSCDPEQVTTGGDTEGEKFECMSSGCTEYHGNCGTIINEACGIMKEQCACNYPYDGDHCERCVSDPEAQSQPDCPQDMEGPMVEVTTPSPIQVKDGEKFSLYGVCSVDTKTIEYTVDGMGPYVLAEEDVHCYPLMEWQVDGLEIEGPITGEVVMYCFTGKDKKGNISMPPSCGEAVKVRG